MKDYFDFAAKNWDENEQKQVRAIKAANEIKKITFPKTNSLIDYGCGTGLLGLQFVDIFEKINLIDSSAEMLQVARQKIVERQLTQVKTHQMTSLADLTTKHSAIVTLLTLHHIDNIAGFFKEANTVLEKDGYLIIADLYKEDGSFHQHHQSFTGHNGFDITQLSLIAINAGFEIIKIHPFHEILKATSAHNIKSYPLFMFIAKK